MATYTEQPAPDQIAEEHSAAEHTEKSPNMYPQIRLSRISHPRATSWAFCLLVIAVAAFGLFVSLSTDAATFDMGAAQAPEVVQYLSRIWH